MAHGGRPDQPEEGRTMFHQFAQPVALLRRHRTRYTSWAAVDGPRIVGVLHYQAANISADEVTINLNGQDLGVVPPDNIDVESRERAM